ncbi:uncharacterized protein J4E88_005549 [Alternaria novae-zelandiae]|uniref:uncharacterized protein n=1 Tax=Alternaria novae-zelandiae TaxID=430562 RepID=UPI0020C38633|nr:uncharacterized protein J4E88_005549 [Alternaria novae-zelandiae]KAI4681044.1 hypothetical protein J4E88_005549 [Alternaria novae-zelandiae]
MDEIDFHNGDGKRLMSRNSDLMQAKREKTNSVRAGLINNIRSKLVDYVEEQFIKRKEDLVSLRHGREWSGFDGLIESCLQRKLFATEELRKKTSDKCIFYYSHSRIEKLVGLIITLIIFVLLVLPVVAMYKLTSVGDRNSTFDAVGILVVFTLLFSAAMSLVTKAKRHELFGASAAYCAVLVVFISNFNNDGSR